MFRMIENVAAVNHSHICPITGILRSCSPPPSEMVTFLQLIVDHHLAVEYG